MNERNFKLLDCLEILFWTAWSDYSFTFQVYYRRINPNRERETWKKPQCLQAWCNFSSSLSMRSLEVKLCMSMTGTLGNEEVSDTKGGSWSSRTYLGGTVVSASFASSWTQGTGRELPRFVTFISSITAKLTQGHKACFSLSNYLAFHCNTRELRVNDKQKYLACVCQ